MLDIFAKGLAGQKASNKLAAHILGPAVLAFLPAVMLAAFWLGGEGALLAAALILPLLYAISALLRSTGPLPIDARDTVDDITLKDKLVDVLDAALDDDGNRTSVCFAIEIDEFKAIEERFGRKAGEDILVQTAERIADSLRDYDVIARVDPATFAIASAPMRQCDLEVAIQMASRLQAAVEVPVQQDSTTIYIQSSVGFCLSTRAPAHKGSAVLDAALAAMVEARRNGPSAIRAFTPEMHARIEARHSMIEDVASALEAGDIQPWFQPQISTETGRVTGFEVLARWKHATRGLVSPAEFLPAVEQAGMMERLGEAMLAHALTALQTWEQAGITIPTIGVNFSPEELRNPRLVDKIKWTLERFEMSPERLTVEVLESVVATSEDDVITRNITALSNMGCNIDLDDFGTGHASIASIRRFSVNRIKIDRSFVMKIDEDQEQQKMLAAILMMAERLDLDTLAEGVETLGEHAVLSQLGCGHVQGYGLARPMPFEDTITWIDRHDQKLTGAPSLVQSTPL